MEYQLGSRIKALRKMRKLTQEQLAEKCGVSTSCVSRWENDALQPNSKNVQALSKALEAKVTELFPTSAASLPESLVIREINSILEQMTEQEQQLVLDTLVRYQEVRLDFSSKTIIP